MKLLNVILILAVIFLTGCDGLFVITLGDIIDLAFLAIAIFILSIVLAYFSVSHLWYKIKSKFRGKR